MKWLRACSEELQTAVQRCAECRCGDCLDEIARDELDERHKGGTDADEFIAEKDGQPQRGKEIRDGDTDERTTRA